MLTPTKEQLADPKWWNENSPEGATHIIPHTTSECAQCWVKQEGGDYFYSYSECTNLWFKWTTEKALGVKHLFVKRPSHKAWRGPEDGFPPVGTLCQYRIRDYNQGWFDCEIKYSSEHGVVAFCKTGDRIIGEQWFGLYDCDFRPLNKVKQDAVDELMDLFIDHYGDSKGSEKFIGITNKLYDEGYRKITREYLIKLTNDEVIADSILEGYGL